MFESNDLINPFMPILLKGNNQLKKGVFRRGTMT